MRSRDVALNFGERCLFGMDLGRIVMSSLHVGWMKISKSYCTYIVLRAKVYVANSCAGQNKPPVTGAVPGNMTL